MKTKKRVLLLSSVCSKLYYETLCKERKRPALDTQQKFLLSIAEGLAAHEGVSVDCISIPPTLIDEQTSKHNGDYSEQIEDLNFQYVHFADYPILRNITAKKSIKKAVHRYYEKHKHEEVYVIADPLSVEVSKAAMFLGRKGWTICAIVTDIPQIAETMGSRKGLHAIYSRMYGRVATRLLLGYDSYILLSDYMNEIVNPELKKPYMIMECIVDETIFDGIEKKELSDKPVVLYAGKFYKECGVLELAKAAVELRRVCEIWLYGGHGDCLHELEKIAEDTDNLKIHGIVPLPDILRIEKNCSILINPRYAEEEFSKYSFPSKTAEYMLSGTPVAMYKLPSLPKEYEEYVFIMDEKDGVLSNRIAKILLVDEKEREELGSKAQLFIKLKKNKKVQAERILKFLS